MMNIDNNGIENTQNTQSDSTSEIEVTETSQVEQTPVDADYEAEFAALAEEEEAMNQDPNAEEAIFALEEGGTNDGELEADEAKDMVGEHYKGDADAEALEAVLDSVEGMNEDEQADVAAIVAAVDDWTLEASDETETKANVEATVEKTESKPKAPPAYVAFIAAVEAHATALGLNVKEQKSFFQFWASSGHKIYVEKALKKNVGRVDTSLPRTALVVNGKDISIPLSKPNGRITCHVDPTIESVKQALEVLATYENKIPAPKKPAAKTVQTTV